MLMGMISGGWLLIRSILVWGDVGGAYTFGIDIPIAATVLLVWAGCVVLLLIPPSSVLARQGGEVKTPALVWPLGRRFRVWAMAAAPICGLLGTMIPPGIVAALGSGRDIWFALPIVIATTALGIAIIWISLRGAILGVELTPTHLIARGYFVTKTHSREDIMGVRVVSLTAWQSYLLEKVMNRVVDATAELQMHDGSKHRLFASNSHEDDLEIGAEIVRDWCDAKPDAATP